MAKETPIINIFTYSLPFDLARQIYNEFQDRLKESYTIIEKYKRYDSLKNHKKTVELLLALSIFHKRVITNLDAAVKFHTTVHKYSASDIIKIGTYELNSDEKNKIIALLINYRDIMKEYRITEEIWEYNFTVDFLRNLIRLKSDLEYDDKTRKGDKGKNSNEDEISL